MNDLIYSSRRPADPAALRPFGLDLFDLKQSQPELKLEVYLPDLQVTLDWVTCQKGEAARLTADTTRSILFRIERYLNELTAQRDRLTADLAALEANGIPGLTDGTDQTKGDSR